MRKYECVLQDGPKDCGICALLTIIMYHGGNLSKEYLRNITNTTSQGVNALDLMEAGNKIGFYTKGVRGDVLKIEDRFLPCIAHVIVDKKYKHFVVIYKIDRKNNNIVIADPSRGILKLDIDKFKSISTSNFFYFIPNRNIPTIIENNLIKTKVQKFIQENKNVLLVVMFFSLIYTIVNIVLSFNFQFVIDNAITNMSIDNLYTILLILLFVYVLKNFIEYAREKLLCFISNKLNCILINDSLNHILSLPLLYFRNRTTGETLSRISDLDELKETLCDFIATIFIDLIITVFAFVLLFSINRHLSLIVIAIIFIYSLLTVVYNRVLYHNIKKIKEKNAVVNSNIIELIKGVNSIKSLNNLDRIKDDFEVLYNNYLRTSYKLSLMLNNKQLLNNITFSLISLIILILGGKLVINGEMKLSSLITFNSIIFYNFTSIKNILNFDLIYKKTRVVIERINELLNINEEKLYYDTNPIKNIKGDINIRNLSYKYGSNYVINNLSFSIKEGQKILIKGNSGCGKSTLAKIISGFLDTKRGKVFIGGVDIKDVNLWNLREQVTYVSQEEYLFSDSIYENINMIKVRDKNKIIDICRCMLIEEIVNKNPSGYNMLLEENGSNISGGERQRIILARTFLKNSSIYILDETFSEINVEKERVILKNIFEKFKDKTIIVISHRFDNNDLYDEIYDMEKYGNRRISREF